MEPTFLHIPNRIHLKWTKPDQTTAILRIVVQPAPEKPTLGGAPSQVGEVILKQDKSQPTAIASLGIKEKINPEIYRQVGGSLARWLLKSGAQSADLDYDPIQAEDPRFGPALLEGILLGAYQFNRHKKIEGEQGVITLQVLSNQAETAKMVERISLIAGAVNLARDWAHEPANIINPVTLAERVLALAKEDGLKVRVLDEKALANMEAGGILSVGKGSATPPRLILIEYPGQGADPDTSPVILIGKALTFDSGGYSMKSVENIQGMKYDKCGGITVIATMHLASQLKIRQPLVGIIGAAENMVSAEAYRPDDIIHMLSGKTVEIISTDAEGRMVLADALAYAQKNYQPRAMIDLATLTGGVVVALGHARAGMMTNDDSLAQKLLAAGETVYERLWRLPLDEEFVPLIKGDDADLKNSGGRGGHAIIGGTFLRQFVDDEVPWAHLDIAGVADTEKELPYCAKGATGFGVRLLLEYLENL